MVKYCPATHVRLWSPSCCSLALSRGWQQAEGALCVTQRIKNEGRKQAEAFLSFALIVHGATSVLLGSLGLSWLCPSGWQPVGPSLEDGMAVLVGIP